MVLDQKRKLLRYLKITDQFIDFDLYFSSFSLDSFSRNP